MKKIAFLLAIVGGFGLFAPTANAGLFLYQFHAQSFDYASPCTTCTGESLDLAMVIAGSFADLPTITDLAIPGFPIHPTGTPDFGNLLAFSFLSSGFNTTCDLGSCHFGSGPVTLSGFFYPCNISPDACVLGVPGWIVSPTGISFGTLNDDFHIAFGPGDPDTVRVNSDGPRSCFFHCEWTGFWTATPIPEPSTIALFAPLLFGIARVRLHRSGRISA